ncbi:uncharacterized protein LOC112686275 [Sipha flava]|uniref:Uncharacterized protein LOC112686275 n=1 Tax=Sipha flava TaxID=143950 RepID=A0A8B8FUV1_9HEMI|nr:uncharacterized protein LOC112686275 [Sipha flava]
MASFKYLIFFALAVYSVSAVEQNPTVEGARVKKHAYLAPAPILAYSAPAPVSYSYATYSAYPSIYSYKYPAYPAATSYSSFTKYPAYSGYAAYPSYAAYPKYAHDDGKYFPGKYEKAYYPIYKSAYPVAYHY